MKDNVSFMGRLGTYRYLDMWKVTEEALVFSSQVIHALANNLRVPTFSSQPIKY
jgi:UDP-galactopyranose mutase